MKKGFKLSKETKSDIVKSAIIAVVLLMAGYFVNNSNWKIFWSEKQFTYYLFEEIRNHKEKDNDIFDDVLFVDVSNAKTYLDKKTVDGIKRVPITKRDVLLEFLQKIESVKNKYVFLDVRFDKENTTTFDVELTDQILKMPNVSIGKIDNGNVLMPFTLMDERLYEKSFYVDCGIQPFDRRFNKYDFLQNGESSIALEMYHYSTRGKHTINKWGAIYLDKCHLAYNSVPLVFHYKNDSNHPTNYNIEHILNDDDGWADFFKDLKKEEKKFVIVGDFVSDRVSTYMGEQPGVVVHWIAYKTLLKGNHKIKTWFALVLFVFYFLITLFILKKWTINAITLKACNGHEEKKIAKVCCSPIVQFIFSLIGISVLLSFLSLMIYLSMDILFSTLIPSIILPLIGNYYQFKK